MSFLGVHNLRTRKVKNINNTSGHTGVNWSEEKQKWHAKLGVNYKRIHLGYFADIGDAIMAYENAKLKRGY